jgi:hypothetical protein
MLGADVMIGLAAELGALTEAYLAEGGDPAGAPCLRWLGATETRDLVAYVMNATTSWTFEWRHGAWRRYGG